MDYDIALPKALKEEIGDYNYYPINFKEVKKEEFENFLIHECVISVGSKQITKKKSQHDKLRGYISCTLFAFQYAYTLYPIGYGLGIDFDNVSIYFKFGHQDMWNTFNTERSAQMRD